MSADPAFGLPSIQTAAVRTDCGRPLAVRLGLRALVVAGFAGAAWLLSANAAQAAEVPAVDPTNAPSVVDVLAGPGDGAVDTRATTDRAASATTTIPVADALATAYQPVFGSPSLLTGAQAPAGTATSVVPPGTTAAHSAPIAGAARAASPTGPGRAASNDAAGGDLTRLVSEPAAVLGLTGIVAGTVAPLSSLHRAVAPVANPLVRALHPITDTLQTAVRPVSGGLDGGTRPVTAVARPAGGARLTPVVDTPPVRSTKAALVGDDRAGTAAGPGPERSHTADIRSTSGSWTRVEPRPAGMPVGRPGTEDVPGGSRPAPLRGYLGIGSGIPTSSSASPTEGGGSAVISPSVAGSAVEFHRLPVPADVVAARQEAESPTVSPD